MTSEDLIERYGDQAYHKAIDFAVIAVNLGEPDQAEMFGEAACELMRRGYHKMPRHKEDEDAGDE